MILGEVNAYNGCAQTPIAHASVAVSAWNTCGNTRGSGATNAQDAHGDARMNETTNACYAGGDAHMCGATNTCNIRSNAHASGAANAHDDARMSGAVGTFTHMGTWASHSHSLVANRL